MRRGLALILKVLAHPEKMNGYENIECILCIIRHCGELSLISLTLCPSCTKMAKRLSASGGFFLLLPWSAPYWQILKQPLAGR